MKTKERIQDLLNQTEVVADPHRQFYKVYFDDNNMDFLFQWLLGYTRNGGGEIGEMFYTAAQIKDFDPDSWAEEWPRIAERVEARAKKSEKEGHLISAREFYLRASNYYRSAIGTLPHADPRFMSLADKSRDCFFRAGSLFDPQIERVAIPFENTTLPGCFIKADKNNEKRKTLIMIGGGETFFTDLYFYIGPSALKRGYNFLTVDIPGQGTLPFEGYIYRPDTEVPIGKVIDYVLSRPDVDPERLAAYGISGGGYYVPRAAVHDKRIKACIANHPYQDLKRWLEAMPIKTQEEAEKMTPTNYRMFELIAWRCGAKNIPGLLEIAKDYGYDPAKINCPFLGVTSEGEYANPVTKAIIDEAFEKVSSKNKKMIVAPFNEGGGTHCLGENTGLMSALVFDWLDGVFGL